MATTCDKPKRLKTFVFLHLNTTGLPEDNPCRITEICMMALDRKSIKDTLKYDGHGRPLLPRVVNKLVLCLDPDADITENAQDISKDMDDYEYPEFRTLLSMQNSGFHGYLPKGKIELRKDLLSKQELFTESTVSLIKSFLCHLKKPYCLIAHYGSGFDFPVLKSELERTGDFKEFANMYCADSLDAVKELTSQNEPSDMPIVSTKRKASDTAKSSMKRSKTEPEKAREHVTTGGLRRIKSSPTKFPSASRSFGAREYFEELFGDVPENSHTAEGYCKALVHILQKTPGFPKWVDRNKTKMADF